MTDDEIRALIGQTLQIVNSNSKSIAANSDAIASNTQAIANLQRLQEATLRELRESIADVVNMLTTQATEAAADRAELRRLIEELYGNRHNGNGSSTEE